MPAAHNTEFRILVATDGSRSARAALQTALDFPWPEASRARGVIALGARSTLELGLNAKGRRKLYAETRPAQRKLQKRWPDASVVALHEAPADAIFSEARRFRADAIVLGWRGYGSLRRLLAGSVSRAVVERARIPVLVARSPLGQFRRVVIGFDASPGAWQAVRFAGALERRRATRAVLVTVLEPLHAPPAAHRLPPSIRNDLRAEIAKLNEEQVATARRHQRAAAAVLRRAGWSVKSELRWGIPLDLLLEAAEARSGSVLVVGERAKRGVKRVLLGSVAQGALDYARVPVVIAR